MKLTYKFKDGTIVFFDKMYSKILNPTIDDYENDENNVQMIFHDNSNDLKLELKLQNGETLHFTCAKADNTISRHVILRNCNQNEPQEDIVLKIKEPVPYNSEKDIHKALDTYNKVYQRIKDNKKLQEVIVPFVDINPDQLTLMLRVKPIERYEFTKKK